MNENEIRTALRNLESRLAMALDNATQAEHDLNRIRLLAGLPPHKYFHLSAAVVAETQVGPKASASRTTPGAAEMMVDAGRVRRGEVVSMAEAARLRVEEDKRR